MVQGAGQPAADRSRDRRHSPLTAARQHGGPAGEPACRPRALPHSRSDQGRRQGDGMGAPLGLLGPREPKAL